MERRLKRFNILFDDESLLYFPGSFLTGKVLLELDENTPATGLHLHVIGEGVVRFSNKRNSKTLASDRENYIDFRMRLLGDGPVVSDTKNGADDDSVTAADELDEICSSSSNETNGSQSPGEKVLVLSPGVHTFPFKLGLPPNLPSTFLGLHGWVQYFCRAILKEPSGLVHKNQQVFIIINPIDLNNEPTNLQQPFYCEAEEKINAGMWRSSSGLISCKVRLDRGGFVPGENIIVSASVENSSKFSIKRTRAVLAETIEYRAKNKIIQSETRELASIERGKIGPRSTDVWKKESLCIPALPPTNLRGCQLIKIHYDVYVSNSYKIDWPLNKNVALLALTFADSPRRRQYSSKYSLRPQKSQSSYNYPLSWPHILSAIKMAPSRGAKVPLTLIACRYSGPGWRERPSEQDPPTTSRSS